MTAVLPRGKSLSVMVSAGYTALTKCNHKAEGIAENTSQQLSGSACFSWLWITCIHGERKVCGTTSLQDTYGCAFVGP